MRPPSRFCERMRESRCFSIESWMQTLQHNVTAMGCLLLATGLGNTPAVRGCPRKPVQFASRYRTVNHKILTMVCRCSFWMKWPHLWSTYVDKRSLPHPGNERQRSVNDFRSCILGNQSGLWLQLATTEVLASFIGKNKSDTLPAPSWKWASNERQRCKVSHLG